MDRSRFPGFFKLTVAERIKAILGSGWIDENDYQNLLDGNHQLDLNVADKMIENVVGVMGLPMGIGLNFLINNKEYIIPLVVEEPSIVAALSSAAKIFRDHGGIEAESDESLLIGQVQVMEVPDLEAARNEILLNKDKLIAEINQLHPNMVKRGGGVKNLEIRILEATDETRPMLVVHLLVDTCDAMGANIVNTMCEEAAPVIEDLSGGRVFLRILSNLTDRSMVRAKVILPVKALEGKGYSGEEVRDGIVMASEFAIADPYRAATHNKGIMNGIDPLAVATGNDWRAIEAAAHAYAARTGRYTALTKWTKTRNGNLQGVIEIPVKVGIQGGSLQANKTASMNLKMLGVKSARELAEIMAAVGLAQNFSAIKALATEGIQRGHMSLHARSVAVTAGAPQEIFDDLVKRLIEEGEITVTRARQLIDQLTHNEPTIASVEPQMHMSANKKSGTVKVSSNGKIILFGEHAVVYGRTAVAVPITGAVNAEIGPHDGPIEIKVPGWKLDVTMDDGNSIWWKALMNVFTQMGVHKEQLLIDVKPDIPPAMGLGGSAAIAVAVIRALDRYCELNLTEEQINSYAYQCERGAHGTPSGVDNTIATFGRPLIFQTGEAFKIDLLRVGRSFDLVVGITGKTSLTLDMVGGVRDRWRLDKKKYEELFDTIQNLTNIGISSIQTGELSVLGEMMNQNHRLLQDMEVSSPELDDMVNIALDKGALGAKMTGAGGGGSMVALVSEGRTEVAKAFENAGYRALHVSIPAT